MNRAGLSGSPTRQSACALLRLIHFDCQFRVTNAWLPLDMVPLTNALQLSFDISVLGQPARLYRIVPLP